MRPELDLDAVTYVILGASTAIKVALLAYCWALRDQSDSIMALAEDHSNDVVSNLGGSRVCARRRHSMCLQGVRIACACMCERSLCQPCLGCGRRHLW